VLTYLDRLLADLSEIETKYVGIVDASEVHNVDPNRRGSGVVFIGAQKWGWVPALGQQEARRAECLRPFKAWMVRFRLLFPDPLPRVAKVLKGSEDHILSWLERNKGDHSISPDKEKRLARATKDVEELRMLTQLLPSDDWDVRVVTDTNVLIDDPDVAMYVDQLGKRYLVHVLPIVMREIDELKRSGRTPELRENAKRADRRLKSYRNNGDVQVGVRVAGDVFVQFEHADPKSDHLPSWLDLSVPDDRFVASVLLLQSDHPSSAVIVATGDMNMQTKLSAVGLPFIEP